MRVKEKYKINKPLQPLPEKQRRLRNRAMLLLKEGRPLYIKNAAVLFHILDTLLVLPFDLGLVVASPGRLAKLKSIHNRTQLNLLLHFEDYKNVPSLNIQTPQVLVVDNLSNFKLPTEYKNITILTTGKKDPKSIDIESENNS